MSQYGALGVERAFGATRALRGVDLEVGRGEIHALLGGNGSGKSTLVKILAGVLNADAGRIVANGETIPADTWSVGRARAAGFHVVHQHGGVFSDLTVAENLALGRGFERTPYGRIRRRDQHRRASAILERFHIAASPETPLGELRAADRMMVAIARALQDQEEAHAGLLILDEPTAALPASEVTLLLEALQRYAAAGQAILYITHRLDEVLQIANRVTVLRDGEVFASRERAGLSEDELVQMIIGRRLGEVTPAQREGGQQGQPLLEVTDLRGPGVDGASFRLHRGELLGIAGLLGSGRTELLRLLFGAAPIESGDVVLDGRPVRFGSPRSAMRAGVALVPEDRAAEALLPDQSVRENLSVAQIGTYRRAVGLATRRERSDARGSLERFAIVAPSIAAPVATLSGGNQQKVVFGRWLRRSPQVMLLDEPTQGVDAGARDQLYRLVREAADGGAGVIVVASDFEELALVCDRVIVLARGRVTDEVQRDELTASRLTELAYQFQSTPQEIS